MVDFLIELHVWSRRANDDYTNAMQEAVDLAVCNHLETHPHATIPELEDIAHDAVLNCGGVPEAVRSTTGVNITLK